MNARNNSDRIASPSLNHNAIHLVEDISEESDLLTEPVALQEMKNYLRLESYLNEDESPAEQFDFDDSLITAQIIEGRMWVEKYTGIHVVPKSLRVYLTCAAGMLELPGPVRGDITIVGETGQSITDGEFIGDKFKLMTSRYDQRLTLTYPAGYTTAPDWVVNAIKAYVAAHYENRGDDMEVEVKPVKAMNICRVHRRVRSWA